MADKLPYVVAGCIVIITVLDLTATDSSRPFSPRRGHTDSTEELNPKPRQISAGSDAMITVSGRQLETEGLVKTLKCQPPG
ncbi:hypothetical protein BaRGS_00026646 [Batillaria attramentaria]|uniref:Secreted protein n=1 Tax=Batillaria attramentaria TaxID=370345 RepID=A0ABD0K3Q5_9CAEN